MTLNRFVPVAFPQTDATLPLASTVELMATGDVLCALEIKRSEPSEGAGRSQ